MENFSTGQMRLVEEPKNPLAMNPKKFAMWLFLASVIMLFASLTSAYVVRRANGDWEVFALPMMFYFSSIIIVISSVTMQLAYWSAKRDQLARVKLYTTITASLGVIFVATQLMGWNELVANGVHFSFDHPAGSFVYVLSGVHGVHLVSAIIFLAIVWASANRMKISSRNLAQMEMCTTYWHFLGGLWLYLFIFLTYFR